MHGNPARIRHARNHTPGRWATTLGLLAVLTVVLVALLSTNQRAGAAESAPGSAAGHAHPRSGHQAAADQRPTQPWQLLGAGDSECGCGTDTATATVTETETGTATATTTETTRPATATDTGGGGPAGTPTATTSTVPSRTTDTVPSGTTSETAPRSPGTTGNGAGSAGKPKSPALPFTGASPLLGPAVAVGTLLVTLGVLLLSLRRGRTNVHRRQRRSE